jgi:flagellar hook-length control protein FliK
MNTPTISAVLPVAGNPAARAPQGGTGPETTPSSFSQVLGQQHAGNGTVRSAAASTDPVKGQQAKPGSKAEPAPTDDEALAQAASEQGLTLAQITLDLAAEVAAVQLPVAKVAGHDSLSTGDRTTASLPAPTGLAPALAPALSADAPLKEPANLRGATLHSVLMTTHPATPEAKEAPLAALLKPVASSEPRFELAAPRARLTASDAIRAHLAGTAGKTAPAGLTLTTQTAEAGHSKAVADFSAAMTVAGGNAAVVNTAPVGDAAAALGGSLSGIASPSVHASTAGNVPQAGTATLVPSVATPLQSPLWAADFSRQFVSITQAGHTMPHTAELRLDPPDLGPLRIALQITDNVAHAVFISPHATVRQTVENALPQLQELLAQAGISLGETSVSDQGQPGQAGQESKDTMMRPGFATASVGDAGMDTGNAPLQAATRARAPDALIDTFA